MRLNWKALQWQSSFEEEQVEVQGICDDTRKLKEGNAFFGYDGLQHQASEFCFEALDKKASAVFLDDKHKDKIKKHPRFKEQLPIFFGKNFLQQSGQTMQAITKVSNHEIAIVGITGTNGKTTIADCLFQMYYPHSSYLGTIGKKISHLPTTEENLTTPSAAHIQSFLWQSTKQKIKLSAIECSSHGIVQGRIAGIDWQFLIFTNLSQDHLDFHETMEEYYEAKKQLFLQPISSLKKPSAIFINTDDSFGKRLYDELKDLKNQPIKQVFDYGFAAQHYQIISHIPNRSGYRFSLRVQNKEHFFKTNFLGNFNVYNMTAVIALAHVYGNIHSMQQWSKLKERVEKLIPVSGRMEIIDKDKFAVAVDYAHTPDALQKALQTILEIKPNKVICVFGCGGDRDKKKRPLMGQTAEELSNYVVLTNDNPRTETPEKIIQDIVAGMKAPQKAKVILNREQAIIHALDFAQENDFILVAGKGHEQYQIFGKEKIYFSDQAVIQKWQPK